MRALGELARAELRMREGDFGLRHAPKYLG